ncbi:sporulation YhaL family protein [Bacillus carboniphilus]|uniref:Sporulation YhaL family protein n=1 Tax=Bacillus carboniphilus TaxID=86663 RepID=A0ABY9JWF7_9BACI|nr:sporulation YhaL family protein [Bacillus carboniphilus]WLR42838.1 sporulation YhaL family protein [Bacillus carboniphilus]
MLTLPWWVYFCIVGILFSGYMAFTNFKKEQEIDEAFIEKEGEIYIERMEKEREQRKKKAQTKGA